MWSGARGPCRRRVSSAVASCGRAALTMRGARGSRGPSASRYIYCPPPGSSLVVRPRFRRSRGARAKAAAVEKPKEFSTPWGELIRSGRWVTRSTERCGAADAGADHRADRLRRSPGSALRRAELGRVGGYGAQRLGDGSEEQRVDDSLVLRGDLGDGPGHGEDDIEYSVGSRSARRRSSHSARTGDWRVGQCRLGTRTAVGHAVHIRRGSAPARNPPTHAAGRPSSATCQTRRRPRPTSGNARTSSRAPPLIRTPPGD